MLRVLKLSVTSPDLNPQCHAFRNHSVLIFFFSLLSHDTCHMALLFSFYGQKTEGRQSAQKTVHFETTAWIKKKKKCIASLLFPPQWENALTSRKGAPPLLTFQMCIRVIFLQNSVSCLIDTERFLKTSDTDNILYACAFLKFVFCANVLLPYEEYMHLVFIDRCTDTVHQ